MGTAPCRKKLDDGGHKTAELGCSSNIHGCYQSACPSILPAENQGKGNARTPAEPTPCSDHDEAGGGNLPKFPGRFPAVPSKRLSGFHGYSCLRKHIVSRRVGLANTARWRGRMENGAKRLSKPFTGCSSFRAAVSAVIQFSLHNKGQVRFSEVYQSSKSA